MKIYVGVTGTLFGLLTVVHIWRMVEEGPRMAEAPWYILITATAAALCAWAMSSLALFTFAWACLPSRLSMRFQPVTGLIIGDIFRSPEKRGTRACTPASMPRRIRRRPSSG